MDEYLKVPKVLLQVDDLSPIEILIISQVLEIQERDLLCSISNDELSSYFQVSVSTVKRAIARLEEKGYITRKTKSIQRGKIRFISVNMDKLTVDAKEENILEKIINNIRAMMDK